MCVETDGLFGLKLMELKNERKGSCSLGSPLNIKAFMSQVMYTQRKKKKEFGVWSNYISKLCVCVCLKCTSQFKDISIKFKSY